MTGLETLGIVKDKRRGRSFTFWSTVIVCTGLMCTTMAIQTGAAPAVAVDPKGDFGTDLEGAYRFLVTERSPDGGALYRQAGGEAGRRLPYSFYDTAEYWGDYVCVATRPVCEVVDIYDPNDHSLRPRPGPAGELQAERVNAHNGTNIYDAATWQIAITLGQVKNKFSVAAITAARPRLRTDTDIGTAPTTTTTTTTTSIITAFPTATDAFALGRGLNESLTAMARRAVTNTGLFVYNGKSISDPQQAYSFRMAPPEWLVRDPLAVAGYMAKITTTALPLNNPAYERGKISWLDWKPITGENAWAFLIGPLQAAHIQYILDGHKRSVPFNDIAVQNALRILPTFAQMQSPLGGVYYAPSGTLANQGLTPVDPHYVSVENNVSLYAGLRLLEKTLHGELADASTLSSNDIASIKAGLLIIGVLIDGNRAADGQYTPIYGDSKAGVVRPWTQAGRANSSTQTPSDAGRKADALRTSINGGRVADRPQNRDGGGRPVDGAWTRGLLAFLRDSAWDGTQFVQAGLADSPHEKKEWVPATGTNAVDVTTWGIAALGTALIDRWFGFGAAYKSWASVKSWGGYGVNQSLWGVGYSNLDGNGQDPKGAYKQGVLSSEWTAGAINMVRNMLAYYAAIPSSSTNYAAAQGFTKTLQRDEASMLEGLEKLRFDNYVKIPFPGKPNNYSTLITQKSKPYVYSSKRYLIPFGWYANPIPSTCATAWRVMIGNRYDPLGYGGTPN